MTDDHDADRSTDQSGPTDRSGPAENDAGPTSRPAPNLVPETRPGSTDERSECREGDNAADARAASLTARVHQILGEVDTIRAQTGDEFSLESLAEQTAKLEQAHEVLTEALADIDRR